MENETTLPSAMAAGDASALCAPARPVSEQHLLVTQQISLPEAQSDAQEAESARQRRLGSFELLDAAMDNVVEHDGNDDVDDHVLTQENSFAARAAQVDAEQVVPGATTAGGTEASIRQSTSVNVQGNGSSSEIQAQGVSTSVNTSEEATSVLAFIESNGAESETNTAEDIAAGPAIHPVSDLSGSGLSATAIAPHYIPVETSRTAQEAVVIFEKCEPELLQWIQARQAAEHGKQTPMYIPVSHDDMLSFIETRYPELLENVAMLFDWLAHFSRIYGEMSAATPGVSVSGIKQFNPYSDDFKLSAIERLGETGNLTEVAHEFGLKSTITLVYWKYQRDEAVQLLPTRNQGGDQGRKAGFAQDQELLEWVLAHRETPITKQDIFNYMVATFPEYASTRTTAALKMWIARFLKKHLATGSTSPYKDLLTAMPVGVGEADSEPAEDLAQPAASAHVFALETTTPASPSAAAGNAHPSRTSAADTLQKRREKRGCPEGYVLHSNEFKLNALRKLDEGKSMSEVTEELKLKSQNTLAYWNSIRDKLATSEKKRFRLAGGGRRSSCTFEEELLTWVTERHQKGEGKCTDVKAVLEYMRESHSSFTDGKKEPTLRKWILRFFKRCWRAPTAAASGSSDAEKAHIFV